MVGGSWRHKRIHQFIWECRGSGVRSIIDYFLMRKSSRGDVQGVKVIR